MTIEKIDKTEQKNILQDFKSELNTFKEQIEKKASWKTVNIDIEKYEKSLWNWLKPLENNISDDRKTKFSNIVDKLLSPTEQVDTSDIIFLETVLDGLESKEIEQTDLEALQETIKELSPTKSKLSQLKQTLTPEVKQVEEKITKYKEKLKSFSKTHPIWTKALIMLLPASLIWLFKQKKLPDTKVPAWMGKIWDMINKIKWLFSSLDSWMAKIAMMFFTFPWIWAPKEMQDLLADMSSSLKNVSKDVLAKFWGSLWGTLKWIKGKTEKEIKKEEQKLKEKIKLRIPNFVKNNFWKKISKEQVEKVLKRINVKALIKNTKNNNNWFNEWLELVTMPFDIFYRLLLALEDENIISWMDIVKYISFLPVDTMIQYGKKTYSLLFGIWSTAMWKTTLPEFKIFLKKLYKKDSKAWQEVLDNLMYRWSWWILKIVWSVWEFATKAFVWSFADNMSFWETIKIMKDSLKWNIDHHIESFKELVQWLPPEASKEFKKNEKGLNALKATVETFDTNAKLVKAYNEAQKEMKNIPNWKKNLAELMEEKYKKLFPWSKINELGFLKKDGKYIDESTLRTKLIDKINWVGLWLDDWIKTIRASFWEKFLGINSGSYVLDDIAKDLKTTNRYLAKSITSDFWSRTLWKNMSKFKLVMASMNLEYARNRVAFKFNDVKSAQDFFRNLKTLAQESPSFVKELIWYSPIIVIAGLEFSKDEKLSEKIKWLWKTLMELVPLVGPFLIIKDALYKDDIKPWQALVWGGLLVSDLWFAKVAWKDGKFLEFMARPFTDVAGVIWMWIRWWVNIRKFWADGVKLVSKWEFNLSEIKNILKYFPKLEWKWRIWFILLALFAWYEFAFANDSEFEEILKDCPNKDKKSCLDKKLKEIWPTLHDETKSQAIALAYGLRTWKVDGVTWEYKDGKYQIILWEDYGVIPNISEFKQVKWSIVDILQRYGDNSVNSENVKIYFSKKLLNKVFNKNKLKTKEQKEKYLLALWYDKEHVDQMIKLSESVI